MDDSTDPERGKARAPGTNHSCNETHTLPRAKPEPTVAPILAMLIVGCALLFTVIVYLSAPSHYGVTQETLCMTRLKGISKAVVMYRMENEDAFPPDLHALITSNFVEDKHLQCPADKTPGGVDFFYVQPVCVEGTEPPDDAILACDLRRNHRDGTRSVAFHGTQVERLREEDFQALLARPENADFAKALRAVEGQ